MPQWFAEHRHLNTTEEEQIFLYVIFSVWASHCVQCVYIKSLAPKGWLDSIFICIRVCKSFMVCLFYAAKCSRDVFLICWWLFSFSSLFVKIFPFPNHYSVAFWQTENLMKIRHTTSLVYSQLFKNLICFIFICHHISLQIGSLHMVLPVSNHTTSFTTITFVFL